MRPVDGSETTEAVKLLGMKKVTVVVCRCRSSVQKLMTRVYHMYSYNHVYGYTTYSNSSTLSKGIPHASRGETFNADRH